MSASSRSWEGWSASSWLNEEPTGPDDDEFDYNAVPVDIATEELFLLIVQLKLQGSLSAKQACCIAFWASKSGVQGEVAKLGLRPDSQSGKFSRRFDEVAGTKPSADGTYMLPVARRRRNDATRVYEPIPIVLPLEALKRELRETREPERELARALEANELPPIYHNHPVVVGASEGEVVHPICLYTDGVAFTRTDSALGLWCYFALSGRRHLLSVLKKTEMCSCGCRGWCSMYPLWLATAWSLAAMAAGVNPSRRHDGQPFDASSDGNRIRDAGQPLGWKAACVFFKCDLAEHSHSMGFPGLRDQVAGCIWCYAGAEDQHSTSGLTAVGPGWPLKGDAQFEAANAACEHRVRMSPNDLALVKRWLNYDKRQQGSHGRALQVDVPHLGLQKHDRLEPSLELMDVSLLDDAPGPIDVLFWRVKRETLTRHRNPIFCQETGLQVTHIGIDWLHALSLGVFQFFLMHLLWELLLADAWGVGGPNANIIDLGVAIFRAELFAWYDSELKAGRSHTRVQQFLPSMLGSRTEPAFRLHGSETNGILLFAQDVLQRKGLALGGRLGPYRVGLDALISIYRAIKAHKSRLPVEAMQRFVDDVAKHLHSAKRLGHTMKPKHHSLIEMAGRLRNPEEKQTHTHTAHTQHTQTRTDTHSFAVNSDCGLPAAGT